MDQLRPFRRLLYLVTYTTIRSGQLTHDTRNPSKSVSILRIPFAWPTAPAPQPPQREQQRNQSKVRCKMFEAMAVLQYQTITAYDGVRQWLHDHMLNWPQWLGSRENVAAIVSTSGSLFAPEEITDALSLAIL